MSITPDITALCAALDAGDDSALGPLADALEEAGDPRAAGMPPAIDAWRDTRPDWNDGPDETRWGWWEECDDSHAGGWAQYAILTRSEFAALPGQESRPHWKGYPSRSAAYLALAEALAKG